MAAAPPTPPPPLVIVVINDLPGLPGPGQTLYTALARARRSGHRALVIAMREVDSREPLDLVADADDVDTARGLARADRAARAQLLHELDGGCRRAGAVFMADPEPDRIVAMWAAAQRS